MSKNISRAANKPPSLSVTMDGLRQAYYASPESRLLSPATKATTDRAFKMMAPIWGIPIGKITKLEVDNLVSGLSSTPGNIHILATRMRTVFQFAINQGWISTNPFSGIKLPKTGEYRPWTHDEFVQFVKGASPQVAMAVKLAYYTGQRISDVLKMKWSDIHDGDIHVIQQKTRTPLRIPVHPKLKTALRSHRRLSKGSYIVSMRDGSQFSVKTFRMKFDREKKAMGMPKDMVFHGLRKLTAVTLAEQGASTHEIMAVGGWKTTKQVHHYCKGANQRAMAQSAIGKLKGR